MAVRYRSGIDQATGKVISGAEHLGQSLTKIWRTRLGERVMLLDFGLDLRGRLAEDLTPALALTIYNDLVLAAARWEPEYLVNSLQLVRITEGGMLGLRYAGTYFPEGRLGNYAIAIPLSKTARNVGAR